jgi:glycolate oxidase
MPPVASATKPTPPFDADSLQRRLAPLVRRGKVLTSAPQLVGYDADGLGYKRFRPDAVVIPADADELASVAKALKDWELPIVIRGAGTSLSGGPVAAQGGVIIHTSALRKINHIDPEGLWCEVECGVTLKQLETALRPYGLFYPPDPSSGPVCTIGGNVAMNAGGAHCFRLGVTGNYVLGVEAILPDGTLHRFGGPAGGSGDWAADWKRLMVGSEGTLGTFTRFWLRLLPIATKAWTFRATFADLQTAEAAIHALVAEPVCPVAIELMDPRCVALIENSPMAVGLPKNAFVLITEIDGPEAWVDAHVEGIARLLRDAGATDLAWSDDPEKRVKLWKARKVAGGLMGQMSPDLVIQDFVIPKRALAATLDLIYREADAVGIPVINVFHAGDGNLHPNFLFDSRIPEQLEAIEAIGKKLMRWVVDVGGTLSGEHGIGNDKMAYMPFIFDDASLKLQLAVAATFNPEHRWNPMKVFAQRRFASNASPQLRKGESKNGATHHAGNGHHEHGGHHEEETLPPAPSRPFEPLFDPVDAVIVVPATCTPDELTRRIGGPTHRLPLLVDPHEPLIRQVAAGPFTPASSRFGPWCDNIIGMNWQLPGGRTIRVGERVVKSTTGYDLLRFYLSAGDRFGEPVDFVLRLRPATPDYLIGELRGSSDSLDRAGRDLRLSPWGVWFDAIERVIDRRAGDDDTIRLFVNVGPKQQSLLESFLRELATAAGLRLDLRQADAPPMDGLADLVIKTTPDRAVPLAARIAAEDHARCQAQDLTGAVLVWLPGGDDAQPKTARTIEPILRKRVDALIADGLLRDQGGQWHSRWLPQAEPRPAEARWLRQLLDAATFVGT